LGGRKKGNRLLMPRKNVFPCGKGLLPIKRVDNELHFGELGNRYPPFENNEKGGEYFRTGTKSKGRGGGGTGSILLEDFLR